jgi:tetratricopeptide (TPR) repeat protein
MASNCVAMDTRCDLVRLERTNMVTKMEDRVKVDLVAMSQIILDQVRSCDKSSLSSSPELINRLAFYFNQGALLQYQHGEIEKAEKLCQGAIEVFARLSSAPGNRVLCLAKMVAPYINLARIYGQKGEISKALTIFEQIRRFTLQQQDLYVLGWRLEAADAPAICAAEANLQKVMLSCGVVEWARVLQANEDYAALLALAKTSLELQEYQDAFFKQYLLEVQTRAFLALGQYEKAMATLSDCCQQMPLNSVDRIVVHLLLAQLYREWARYELAGEALNKLENYLTAVEQYSRKLPVLRQVAYRLALERHLLGDNRRAIEPAEKSFQWCREWNDQVGSIKASILLLRICTTTANNADFLSMGRHWYGELLQLASTSFFRLERASAYWELGLSLDVMKPCEESSQESTCLFLRNSYDLYRSVPLVDSKRSCEAVKRSLDRRLQALGAHTMPINGSPEIHSRSVDAVFDELMEYVTQAAVETTQ